LTLQEKITREKHQAIVGQTLRILVEGPSRGLNPATRICNRHPSMDRTRLLQPHHPFCRPDAYLLEKKELLTGAFADIMIEGAYAHSLWGRLIRGPMIAAPGKGETTIAA
jgi:tRNA A37 methylthiotransferase MiaB